MTDAPIDWPADWYGDADTPPDGCTLLGPGVAYSVGRKVFAGDDTTELLVWHRCDHSVWLRNGGKPELIGAPYWTPGGVGLHTLVELEPLHLEPSLYWRDCCDVHGFVRDGRWLPV